MIGIIIVSFLLVVFFVAFLVYIVKLIIRAVKKEKPSKPLVIKTILSGFLWLAMCAVNIVLIIMVVIQGDPLIDSLINAGADTASKALVYTFEGLEKNWNKDTLAKANLVGFKIISVKKTEEGGKDAYEVNLLIENKLGRDKPISYWDLVSQNLIFGLDGNDVFYPVTITGKPADVIPVGKSYVSISILLPKFARLEQIGIGDNRLDVGN